MSRLAAGAALCVLTAGVSAAVEPPRPLPVPSAEGLLSTCCRPAPAACAGPGAAPWQTASTRSAGVPVATEFRPTTATCNRPVCRVATTAGHAWVWPAAVPTAADCLTLWAAASQAEAPWTPRHREWFRRHHHGRISEHTLDMAARLWGPVEAAALRDDCDWTVSRAANGLVELTAVPKDATDRLFCSELRVVLERSTGELTDLQLCDRHHGWQTVSPPVRGSIQLVVNVAASEPAGLPPRPSPAVDDRTIRFASDGVDLEIRRR